MDWRNDESDNSSVENFTWDEKSVLSKNKSDASLSGAIGCNVCSQGVQANFGNCKESRSFASVLERLELDAELEARNEIPLGRTNDAQTEPFEEVEQELYSLSARDVFPCRQVLRRSDILYFQVRHPTITRTRFAESLTNFQGVRYPPEDIASYWKKDSRMWLWKSIRLMRRRNKPIPPKTCETNNENKETE
nr:uncharacterized protein LOC117230056 [Megalopta genalis]